MGKHGEGCLYRKRGRGAWRVRWTFGGKTHDETTGELDYERARKIARRKTACSEALGDVRALTARLERAKDEQTVLEAKYNPSLNLYHLIDAFKSCDVVRRRKNSIATLRGWDSNGNLLINHFGGNMEMRQLTREKVEGFMRQYESKVSPAQFNTTLQFFKRVWSVLGKYDSPTELKARLGSESPWDYILPMKVGEVVGKRPFTKEQLTRIWRVLEKRNDADLTLLFDLARNTGARLHDLVSWKWDEHLRFNSRVENGEIVNEAVLEWKPLKTRNSSGKLMVIPILDKRVVMELWSRWQKRDLNQPYILPRMLEMYNRNHACPITHLCQGVFKDAGIQTMVKVEGNARSNCVYGMHSFRHTLVSELFDKGVDLGTIAHLYTGHGSSYMTELYAHADIDKKRVDLSKLARIDVEQKRPDGFQTLMGRLNDEDRKEYDAIKVMDAPPMVKNELVGLLRFKSREELTMIRDWLNGRLDVASDGCGEK